MDAKTSGASSSDGGRHFAFSIDNILRKQPVGNRSSTGSHCPSSGGKWSRIYLMKLGQQQVRLTTNVLTVIKLFFLSVCLIYNQYIFLLFLYHLPTNQRLSLSQTLF